MSSPAVAPYGAYRTADGQTVVLGTTNDREWQRLAREIIERPDLADDPRFATNSDRVANRAVLDEAIESWCGRHDLVEVQKVADAAGIGNARYNLPSEVLEHPQLSTRDRWRTVQTAAGPSGRSCRRRSSTATSSRWGRSPASVSTPTPCSPNWDCPATRSGGCVSGAWWREGGAVMREAVIVEAVRTPVGKRNGGLSGVHAADLSAVVLNALVDRTGLDPSTVDDVVWGCVSQVGDQSSNIGRFSVLAAGWPESIPGTTVNRACGSSQQALDFAAQAVAS